MVHTSSPLYRDYEITIAPPVTQHHALRILSPIDGIQQTRTLLIGTTLPKKKTHQRGRATKPDTSSAPTTSDTIYFYLPNVKPYGVFSQWAPSPFNIPTSFLAFLTTRSSDASSILSSHAPSNILAFTCAEQSYMFCKALYFGDSKSCTLILGSSDPKTPKKVGSAVKGSNDYEWGQIRSRAARVGNWYKYTDERNQNMKKILLDIGGKGLAEASRRDLVRGIGYSEKEAESFREMWGQNLLAKCLGDVRWRIEREEKLGRTYGDWDGEMVEKIEGADPGCIEDEEEEDVMYGTMVEGSNGVSASTQ